MADNLRKALAKQLKRLRSMDDSTLCERRLAHYELWCVVAVNSHQLAEKQGEHYDLLGV